MLATLQRRGPDGSHAWRGENAALGRTLLVTTPESRIPQPWQHSQTGCVVVSDSRLDNRLQLLRALGINGHPDTIGDGELLHAAWQHWGRDCANRLRGDFAFALWDPREHRLFCARDPMGVRPFYLHHRPGQLIAFASSADAVLAHGGIDRNLDEGRIADALIGETEGIDATRTFFLSVQRLPPAHTLEWHDGRLRQDKYWHPLQDQLTGLPTTDDEWIEAQREQLQRAVQLRLRSQHPVGSMLSGGLDSSSVVALAGRLRQQADEPRFPSFSAINSRDPGCAETAAVHAVLAATHSNGHLTDLKDMDALAPVLLEWWQRMGEPFDGTMVLGASVFHSASRAGVRSLMDGVPADNFFTTAGYDHALVRRGQWRAAWQVKREYIAAYSSPRWAGLKAAMRLPGGLLAEGLMQVRHIRSERKEFAGLVKASLIDPAFTIRVDLQGRFRRYRRNIAQHAQLSPDAKLQSSLGVAYITAGIERYNRIASHFGIEPRPPFTDRDLIAFQARVPWHLRLRDGRPKWILRQAMRDLLPPEVLWRPGKEHLGATFSATLLQGLPVPLPEQLQTSPVAAYVASNKLQVSAEHWRNTPTMLRIVLLDQWLASRLGTCR
ncbi:asparagine synthase-related protein [Thermomonas sp. HDW16]|uniref:asparagine synthase-related protein n=1 Tax=Thermomonas sp. HDW16 TaxID=2714945 RepID=UPI001F112A31|nr:asparagine synthase-related protein [Thermomonas sp. HDW16]